MNLAFVLSDGCKVNIPNIDNLSEDFVCVTFNEGEGVIIDSGNGKESGNKVNINTATQSELETITGIGPSIAAKIIKYREESGKFKSIEDIMNVTGIGEEKFNNLKDEIRVR